MNWKCTNHQSWNVRVPTKRLPRLATIPKLSLLLYFMQQWLQKILLFIAVITIAGHSALPHYHHDQIETAVQHNHHDDEKETGTPQHEHDEHNSAGHSLFSFAQLDDDYVPEQFHNISIELPIGYLLTPLITYYNTLIREKSKTQFGYHKDYPPPGAHLTDLNHRGPPSLLG